MRKIIFNHNFLGNEFKILQITFNLFKNYFQTYILSFEINLIFNFTFLNIIFLLLKIDLKLLKAF